MITPAARAPRLRDQVYASLKTMLRDGTLPDARLREEEIAAALHVSRTPVREALFQLCREGFIEDTGRGYRRPELKADDVREIVELRRLLEPTIARHVVRLLLPETLAAFAAIVAREADAATLDDPGPFVDANGDFRALFLESCGNKRLAQVMRTFDDQIASLRRQTLGPLENRQATLGPHQDFVAALRLHDGGRAAAAVNALLDAASDYYETIW